MKILFLLVENLGFSRSPGFLAFSPRGPAQNQNALLFDGFCLNLANVSLVFPRFAPVKLVEVRFS